LDFAVYISSMIIPLLFFYIVATAVTKKTQVYDDFVEGAEEGLKTVVKILPTLIGLMVGVGILRNSGFLDFYPGKTTFFDKDIRGGMGEVG